jgi:hypothetical protein
MQFPILQDKSIDAMAMVFHVQAFLMHLPQVNGHCRIESRLKERLMDLDIECKMLWIGQVVLEQDQLRCFYHGLRAMKEPHCFNVLQWHTMHLTPSHADCDEATSPSAYAGFIQGGVVDLSSFVPSQSSSI